MSKRIIIKSNDTDSPVVIPLTENFDPIKHPRNPETGKFVERPYPVPDNISNLPTQQILGDLWAEDPNFSENIEDIAVDMGRLGTQTVDTIIERAKEGNITGGVRAQRRDIFERSDLDMSFSEFESRIEEVKSGPLGAGLDDEGAALTVINQESAELV